MIKSKQTGEIIYIGYSSNNVYRTLYRHFQTWNDTSQNRFVYDKNRYTVRVILTTPQRAQQLEKALIKHYKPRDNKNKYTQQELTPAEIETFKNYFATDQEPAF